MGATVGPGMCIALRGLELVATGEVPITVPRSGGPTSTRWTRGAARCCHGRSISAGHRSGRQSCNAARPWDVLHALSESGATGMLPARPRRFMACRADADVGSDGGITSSREGRLAGSRWFPGDGWIASLRVARPGSSRTPRSRPSAPRCHRSSDGTPMSHIGGEDRRPQQ